MSNSIFLCQSASTMLDEKQKDGLSSANDGFYESRREWLGRRHFILAFERYYIWIFLYPCFFSLNLTSMQSCTHININFLCIWSTF